MNSKNLLLCPAITLFVAVTVAGVYALAQTEPPYGACEDQDPTSELKCNVNADCVNPVAINVCNSTSFICVDANGHCWCTPPPLPANCDDCNYQKFTNGLKYGTVCEDPLASGDVCVECSKYWCSEFKLYMNRLMTLECDGLICTRRHYVGGDGAQICQ